NIVEKKEDMPFLKTATQDIFDIYLEIFRIDFRYFYDEYIESAPLMVLAILMNPNLRDIYLQDEHIKKDLERFQNTVANEEQVFKKDTHSRWVLVSKSVVRILYLTASANVWVNNIAQDQGKLNTRKAIGKIFEPLYFCSYNSSDNVKYVRYSESQYKFKEIQKFKGQTDGYWKDLEVESTKVMVLSIPYGTFIRSANKPKEELSAEDVNGNFLILDGLLYKSNDDSNPIVYMEV
ncbi:MAG: hypothetical protein KAI79_09945, partial [Bacteroidales bacterium]|nr:hypothetical protein [Bacteroidales bacterium]